MSLWAEAACPAAAKQGKWSAAESGVRALAKSGSFSFRVGASGIVEPGPSYARKGVLAALVRFLLRVAGFFIRS